MHLTRRSFLATSAAITLHAAPANPIIDTHVHLFDPTKVPYAPNAPYQPPAQTVESYNAFAQAAGIDHTVIVHPEPYQNDHRYLEYCFAHEPRPGFFKGTCLFDPISPETPKRMEALVKKHPRRIVALRIHAIHKPGTPPLTSGPIKDRDLRSPAMQETWKAAHSLGLGIQMHFIPYYAPQIGDLAAKFPDTPVILDHLARSGQGTADEFQGVLKLAKHPRVIMKYSGVEYSPNAKSLIKPIYDAFGPDRIIWGTLGYNRADYDKQAAQLNSMFDFAPESDRIKIRGLNAKRLFQW